MIQSMTGFARCEQMHSVGRLTWEMRAVNHRYLDINLRLPEVCRPLEPAIRQLLKQQLSRGKIDGQLWLETGDGDSAALEVNMDLAKQLLAAEQQLVEQTGIAASFRSESLLRWPGVLHSASVDSEQLEAPVLALVEQGLQSFKSMRQREGEALAQSLLQRIVEIQRLAAVVESALPEIQQQYHDKLLSRFEEASIELDPERLAHEMVLVAQKMDVAEELERLAAHCQELQRIVEKGGVAGRKLDFLMQEFNREANTLGSKSMATTTTQAAVELKVLIEQMREQVQNIE